jgi:hypothetical protein
MQRRKMLNVGLFYFGGDTDISLPSFCNVTDRVSFIESKEEFVY